MTKQFRSLSFTDKAEITYSLHDLVRICDSFDQLTKIAEIGDILLIPGSIPHTELSRSIEVMCRHLRGLPFIGRTEVIND